MSGKSSDFNLTFMFKINMYVCGNFLSYYAAIP